VSHQANTSAKPRTIAPSFRHAPREKDDRHQQGANAQTPDLDAANAGSTYINYAFNPATWSGGNLAAFEANTGGNSVALFAVPEPSSLGMLMASLGVALGLQRFRRRRNSNRTWQRIRDSNSAEPIRWWPLD
jgi:hypothetical protein